MPQTVSNLCRFAGFAVSLDFLEELLFCELPALPREKKEIDKYPMGVYNEIRNKHGKGERLSWKRPVPVRKNTGPRRSEPD